jgi:hypothetical protein
MINRQFIKKVVPASAVKSMKSFLGGLSGNLHALAHPAYYYGDFTLTPSAMRRAAAEYDKKGASREAIAWNLLDKISVNRLYGSLLDKPYFSSEFSNHLLYLILSGANAFQSQNYDQSVVYFTKAVEADPSRLNYLLLARAMKWNKNVHANILNTLETGMRRNPADSTLPIALATTIFLNGNTSEANRILSSVKTYVESSARQQQPYLKEMQEELNRAISEKLLVRPKGFNKDGYREENIRDTFWEDYWCEMNLLNRSQFGRGFISEIFQERISAVLSGIGNHIGTVINFGVMCGYPDYALAKRFPQVTFIGVDREIATAELNRKAFILPNLKFYAGDITDLLPNLMAGKNSGETLLFHARTTTLIYPEWVKRFYRLCFDVGVEHLLLYENLSLSKTLLRFIDLEQISEDAILFQNGQYIHNYPQYLEAAGFQLTSSERLREEVMFHLHDGIQMADTHCCIAAKAKIK